MEKVNQQLADCWDWQVTICFYVAIHLVNSHLADKLDIHYRRHNEVENAINPYVHSPVKFPDDEYAAYMGLKSLARRSRYLVHETDVASTKSHFTYDKHLARSIRHLEKIIKYLSGIYTIDIDPIKISCIELKESDNLEYFTKS